MQVFLALLLKVLVKREVRTTVPAKEEMKAIWLTKVLVIARKQCPILTPRHTKISWDYSTHPNYRDPRADLAAWQAVEAEMISDDTVKLELTAFAAKLVKFKTASAQRDSAPELLIASRLGFAAQEVALVPGLASAFE